MSNMKKKLLFVSTRPPYPLLSGEKNKAFNQIKILSKKYDLIYCGLCSQIDKEEVLKLLGPYCYEIHLVRSSFFKSLVGALRALLTGLPLQIGYFNSKELEEIVERESKSAEGAFINLFRAVQYVLKVEKPLFLEMSDSISEHYKNAVKVTSSSFWKLIYAFEAKRMRRYEEEHLDLFKKVFLYNPLEIELYKRSNMRWIPHGVNQKIINYKLPREIKRNYKISFLGKMDYRPNVEAVKWFVARVLPYLDEKFSFQIIGAYPSKEVLQLKGPRVEVTGFVDDPYLLLKESFCVVAPMVSGGGIQNKLLESMSIGCVNVVSSICARPLIDVKGEIIVEDEPQKMAQIINQLDPESESYRHYSEISREYILKNYTWEKFEEVLYREVDV